MVANGSSHEGPARADRLREKYAKHQRQTQRAFDALPPYTADDDSSPAEVTGSWQGITAKLGMPRWTRAVLGVSLSLGLLALLLALAWRLAH